MADVNNWVGLNSEEGDFWDLLEMYDELDDERVPRLFRDRADPVAAYDDEDFRARYRLEKRCVLDLLQLLTDQLQHTSNRLGVLSPIQQLLIALRFYSTGSFQVQHAMVIF
jgi:hypothetical protein